MTGPSFAAPRSDRTVHADLPARPIIGRALGVLDALIADPGIAERDRSALERLAAHRRRIGDRPSTRAEIAASFGLDRAAGRRALARLARADIHHPDIGALFAFTRPDARRRKRRARSVTVPPDTLPAALKEDLAGLRASRLEASMRRHGPWDPVRDMEEALCKLCLAARRAGMSETFCQEAIGASIAWHVERKCRAISILAHLVILDRFARWTGRSVNLRTEMRYWRRAAHLEGKTKEAVLAATGLTRDRLLERARSLRRAAQEESDPFVARMLRQQAALVALSSEVPLRRRDAAALRIGLSLIRTPAGWRIDLITRKEDVRIARVLDDPVREFLDDAVLLGASTDRLEALYAGAIGRHMFTRPDGEALTPAAVTRLYQLALGTGGHIARTLIYNAFAATPEGEAEAASRCGHKGFGGSRAYLSDDGRRARSVAAIKRYQHALRQAGFLISPVTAGEGGSATTKPS
jgi:hypothetical protein